MTFTIIINQNPDSHQWILDIKTDQEQQSWMCQPGLSFPEAIKVLPEIMGKMAKPE